MNEQARWKGWSWKQLAATACLGLIVAGLAGCGGTSTSTTTNAAGQTVTTCHTSFAKTKFVAHVGVALFTFDRYIYKPFRAGSFKNGAPGRAAALAKAAGSAVVVYHELNIATQDARCGGPTLQKLVAPLTSAATEVSSLKTAITGGDATSIPGAKTLLQTLTSAAKQNGAPVG